MKNFFRFGLIAFVTLAASCAFPVSAPSTRGGVIFALEGLQSKRTLAPDLSGLVDHVHATFVPTAGTTFAIDINANNTPVYLTSGADWTATFQVVDASGTIIGSGETTVLGSELGADVLTRPVVLKPGKAGTGTFTITFRFPSRSASADFSVTAFPDTTPTSAVRVSGLVAPGAVIPNQGLLSSASYTLDFSAGTATVKGNLPSGNYIVSLVTIDANAQASTHADLLAVYDHLSTVGTVSNPMRYVHLQPNGGTGALPSVAIPYLAAALLPANTFAMAGFDPQGWNTMSDASGIHYSAGDLFTMSASSDVDLWAQWRLAAPSSSVGYYLAGGGSGGGGGGDYTTDYTLSPLGGNAASSPNLLVGSPYNDVIFGDGSGGGGGGSQFRSASGGNAGGGNDTIRGGAGDDILFGDGFFGATSAADHNGAAGGFGGGGGGGGSYGSVASLGGAGGILAGGGGSTGIAVDGGTPGASFFGGSAGGTAQPSGVAHIGPNQWGGNAAAPSSAIGYYASMALGGTANNSFGAGGGAGFGGVNSWAGQPLDLAHSLFYSTNGGNPQGGNGANGVDQPVFWLDTTGSLYAAVKAVLPNIFTSVPGTAWGVGAGADLLDGGPGSDDLFGLGGNDTFEFELTDAGTSDIDTIWDFDRFGDSDHLRLLTGGTLITTAQRDAIIAAQVGSGADRILVFDDGGTHSVGIVVKSIGRSIAATDFE